MELLNLYYLLYLNKENYEKILKCKNIYKIEFIGFKGLIKYLDIFKRHYLFFGIFILALIYIFFLSNIVFKI